MMRTVNNVHISRLTLSPRDDAQFGQTVVVGLFARTQTQLWCCHWNAFWCSVDGISSYIGQNWRDLLSHCNQSELFVRFSPHRQVCIIVLSV